MLGSFATHLFPKGLALAEFFGARPTLCVGGVQWFYDCVALEYVRGDDVVHIEIDASCVILRVEWTQRSVERLRLDLNRVRGFSIDRDEGQDVLVVHLVDPRASDLRLRLAPTVHLHWGHLAC